MKAKRREPQRRGDRGNGRDASARTRGRVTADSARARPTRRERSRTTSTPNRDARVPKSGPQTSPMPRPDDRPARPKSSTQAKARAKARKAKAPKAVQPKLIERLASRLASIDLRPQRLASKVPFVVLIIGALGVGLGLTLWLSTDAAERSYELSHARARTRLLQQEKEALERRVREARSAPALAEAAREQGMIPTRDTAHLVQGPEGNWMVVGEPKPADGVPPPPLNSKLPDEGPPPPPKPDAVPLEVPVRVTPGPEEPAAPAGSGPQVLLRTPDGTATLGGGTHLPRQAGPQSPGPVPGLPAQVPMPHAPVPMLPGQVPVVPGQVPAPLGGAQVPTPAGVPGPGPVGATPPLVRPGPPSAAVPRAGAALAPRPTATAPVPVRPGGEQFGPVTPSAPGVGG
ncbi:FtsB family cell division protein [Mycobacterium spongiae]|uniref:Uncharacterized protein n=1 Tax=Mycobacterium spongiae TaxID=886343 RepID=A0A975K0K7_9MYCO|nr:hypothetical protein [Mycobacterium spongiae]QUR67973.1 hypothetical protein F6B93_13470 [Mycobacterium spongiae]